MDTNGHEGEGPAGRKSAHSSLYCTPLGLLVVSPRYPGPLPGGEGECGGTLRELSTRLVSSQREERFSKSSGRQSGAAVESGPGAANPTKSNLIQPNPTRINV